MDRNKQLFTLERDGTVQKWYMFAWYGNRFAVATKKNAKLRDAKKYYCIDDIGKTIFLTRKDASAAANPPENVNALLER